MKTLVTCGLLAAIATASSLASAHRYEDDFDFARVTRVEPIYETASYSKPREECWNEQVPVRSYSPQPRSYTAPILGAIIGGALGNALGHHEVNKRVGTVAGAALGASVGRDVRDRDGGDYERTDYSNERVCQTVNDREYHEEVVAYRVFYRYNGRDFVTRKSYDPGSRLRVRVNVDPDE
ncbi:MAG: putative outer rane lipoprotein [Verrucomicrobiaceae bacterium]|nr:putative outer rane lipoprotein [Verrucomicrobiaceae bacterium]